jgi:origin recognition complex subunit 2
MPKRRQADDGEEEDDPTPRKTRKSVRDDDRDVIPSRMRPAETPSKRKSILKETPSKVNGFSSVGNTPSSLRKVLFATPSQAKETIAEDGEETPTAVRNDRSAHRKSRQTLQKQLVEVEDSEEDERDEAIAAAILGEEEEDDEEDDEDEIEVNATPSKTGKPRGRPKGRRRERTPSPPPDLPPHELYFFQNRAGGNKTSTNTLQPGLLLAHDDYFAQISAYTDPHAADISRLESLHESAFSQWAFELSQGFNLCLYGYGSKRALTTSFATHLYYASPKPPTIAIVNGYTPNLTPRDICITLSSALLPKSVPLPSQPMQIVDVLLPTLTPGKHSVHLLIHSLDSVSLRRSPILPAVLARLSSHPCISLLATVDTPSFPFLPVLSHPQSPPWLYHDATTFAPLTLEVGDVVEDVNALLGRSTRRLGGKDGVAYVLKSLPENARRLFAILIAEQLALMDEGGADFSLANGVGDNSEDDAGSLLGASDDDIAANEAATPTKRIRGKGRPEKKAKAKVKAPKTKVQPSAGGQGVEYRTLYHKAVEEFVCSSEVGFRTLLKEFHDHRMIESRTDSAGTERLVVPFGRAELEGVLGEIV